MNALLLTLSLLLATPQDTTASDSTLLALCEGLRVANVVDAMDMVGLRNGGLVDPRIQPLWRDLEDFRHHFCGIALTLRYVPTNKIIPNPMVQRTVA